MKQSSFRSDFAVFILTALLLLTGLWQLEVLMIDTRFGLFVYEMMERGIGPYAQLYGKYYPDYTSIPTFLMMLSAKCFGAVNQFTLALPSTLCGAGILAMAYHFGKKYFSVPYALSAVFLMLSCFEFLNICRIASIDLFPALAASAAFFLALESIRNDRKGLSFWIIPCMIAGYLTRGPIGCVIVTAAAIAPAIVCRKFGRVLLTGIAGIVIIAVFFQLYLYWARQIGGEAFVDYVLSMQVASRVGGSGKSIFYYFTNAAGSYALGYPLGLAVLFAMLIVRGRSLRQTPGSDREILFQSLALWALLVLLGMSIPSTKHLRYVVSAIPPLGMIAAMLFEEEQQKHRFFAMIGRILLFACRLAPFAVILAAGGMLILRSCFMEKLELTEPLPLFPVIAVAVLGFLLLFFSWKFRRNRAARLGILALSFFCIHVGVLENLNQSSQSSRRFVKQSEGMRPNGQQILFFALGPDGDENKYLFHVEREKAFVPQYLAFRENEWIIREYLQKEPAGVLSHGSLVIARADKWRKSVPESRRNEFETLHSGQLGHRQVLLLKKR